MKLTAEQIQANWEKFLTNIKEHISGNRGEMDRELIHSCLY